jgi:hypothetical protein
MVVDSLLFQTLKSKVEFTIVCSVQSTGVTILHCINSTVNKCDHCSVYRVWLLPCTKRSPPDTNHHIRKMKISFAHCTIYPLILLLFRLSIASLGALI